MHSLLFVGAAKLGSFKASTTQLLPLAVPHSVTLHTLAADRLSRVFPTEPLGRHKLIPRVYVEMRVVGWLPAGGQFLDSELTSPRSRYSLWFGWAVVAVRAGL